MNKKFEVMTNNFPELQRDERDTLIQQLLHQNVKEVQNKIERLAIEQSSLKEEVSQVKSDLNNKVTLDHGQQQALNNAKKARVRKLWFDNEIEKGVHDTERKLHGAAGKALKDAFGVSSYRDIKEKDFDEAMNFVKSWRPRIV